MKNILPLFSLFLLYFQISAQSPDYFNYQAVVRDLNGQVITNSDIQIRVSILIGNTNGEVVYQELQSTETNAYGQITLKMLC